MCVFECGKTLARAKPTLVIMVEPGAKANWKHLADKLGNKFDGSLDVKFLPSGPSSLTSNEGDDGDGGDGEGYDGKDAEGEDEDELFVSPKKPQHGFRPPSPKTHNRRNVSINLWSRDPTMEADVGVVGEEGGNTLGGFVDLTIGDQVHRGWLTNNHVTHRVIRLEDDTLSEEENLQVARFGCGSESCRSLPPVKMAYPARDNL